VNQLSWLLYLANVAGTASVVLGVIGGLSLIASIIFALIHFCMREDTEGEIIIARGYSQERVHKRDESTLEAVKTYHKGILTLSRRLFITFVVSLVVFVATPRAETVYAIAASEMGEKVLKTPTAQKAFQALDAWLDKQIRENK